MSTRAECPIWLVRQVPDRQFGAVPWWPLTFLDFLPGVHKSGPLMRVC